MPTRVYTRIICDVCGAMYETTMNKTRTIGARLNECEVNALKTYAAQKGLSVSTAVRKLLADSLKSQSGTAEGNSFQEVLNEIKELRSEIQAFREATKKNLSSLHASIVKAVQAGQVKSL